MQIYVILRKSARKLSLFFYLMILFRLKCMPKITKMPYLAFWAGKCCNKFPVGLFCLIELCCSIVCGMEMCGCRENGTFPLIPQYHYKYNFLSTWATKSCSVFCHVRFFTYRRRRLFCLRHSYATSINSSWRGLTWRGSDSKQQAASRRLSSSSSLVYCSTLSLQKKVFGKSPTFPTPAGETCSIYKGFRVKDRV